MIIWGQRSAFVLQLLNLTAVLGFMTSPLLVKPFLHTDTAGDNSTQCSGRNATTNSTAVTSSCDVTVTSHHAVTHVFVIVAVYSLLIGLLMLAIFVNDYVAHRRHAQRSGGVMQMSEAAAETSERLYPTSDNIASRCDFDPVTTATSQTVVTFRVKIALLFFAFNFFYGGIEVGYAGLVMTYAVTYLDWSKDDGLAACALKVCGLRCTWTRSSQV